MRTLSRDTEAVVHMTQHDQALIVYQIEMWYTIMLSIRNMTVHNYVFDYNIMRFLGEQVHLSEIRDPNIITGLLKVHFTPHLSSHLDKL